MLIGYSLHRQASHNTYSSNIELRNQELSIREREISLAEREVALQAQRLENERLQMELEKQRRQELGREDNFNSSIIGSP